jgi:hypothetical protein
MPRPGAASRVQRQLSHVAFDQLSVHARPRRLQHGRGCIDANGDRARLLPFEEREVAAGAAAQVGDRDRVGARPSTIASARCASCTSRGGMSALWAAYDVAITS